MDAHLAVCDWCGESLAGGHVCRVWLVSDDQGRPVSVVRHRDVAYRMTHRPGRRRWQVTEWVLND